MNRALSCTLLAMTALAAVTLATGAQAQELVGGWEGDGPDGYAFLSPAWGVDLGGGDSLVFRGAASYLYYTTHDAGGSTDVSSPGGSLGLAFRYRTPRLTLTFGPGYEARQTRRSPATGTSETVQERGFTLQGDAYFQATRLTTLTAIASYGDANRYAWARAGLKRQVTNTSFTEPTALLLGVELTGQGNYEIHTAQAGGLLEVAFLKAHGSLQLRGGFSRSTYRDGSRQQRAYFGLGFYRAF